MTALRANAIVSVVRPGLRLWLTADPLGLASGATVARWTDLSGWNGHATEATHRPAFQPAKVQGLAVVHFDGLNDLLTGALGGISTALTVLAVVKFSSIASGGGVLELATTGGSTRCLALFQESSAIKLRLTGSPNALASQVTYAFSDTSSYHMIAGTHDTASRSLRQDGAAKATTTYTDALPAVPSEYQVGSLYPPSYPLPGSLAEVLVYDRVLPPSELTMVERTLGARYGISIA